MVVEELASGTRTRINEDELVPKLFRYQKRRPSSSQFGFTWSFDTIGVVCQERKRSALL